MAVITPVPVDADGLQEDPIGFMQGTGMYYGTFHGQCGSDTNQNP